MLFSICLSAQQYHFQNYGLNEGLAQSQVFKIMEDSRGYLWMGTNGGGISRFNGLEFETFTTNDGLPSNYALVFHEDINTTIWIGTSRGVACYNGYGFEDPKLWNEKVTVNSIAETSDSSLWFGTNKGLYHFKDSKLSRFDDKDFKFSRTITFLRSGKENSLYVGSYAGLAIIQNGRLQKSVDRKNGLSSNYLTSTSCLSKNGCYIGTYGSGVNVLVKDDFFKIDWISELKEAVVNDVYEDKDGKLWIATLKQGVCIYQPKDSSYIFLNEKDGLANNYVNTILEDSWGNYWFGTTGGGVSKYSGQQFEHYSSVNGLKGSYVFSILAQNPDEIWLTTSGGGLTMADKQGFVNYNRDSGFTDLKCKALLMSSDSLLWIGTEGEGIAIYNRDTFSFISAKDGLGSNWIKSIREDHSATIWVATAGGGITSINRTKKDSSYVFKRFTQKNGLVSNRFIHLHVDKLNRVWYASRSGGIGYIEKDSLIYNFNDKYGLQSNVARSLAEDSLGNLWVATNQGVSYLNLYSGEIKIKPFEANDQLPSRNVYLLKFDQQGHLWVGTEKGVTKFKLDEDRNVLESFHFGNDEGFTGVETNLNAVSLSNNGDMWFGTVGGLHKYIAEVDLNNSKAPILNFTNISLGYTPIQESSYALQWNRKEGLKLEYDEGNLTFEFLGVTQTFPKKVRYQWKLEGLDENWSPISQRNQVNYSNLAPGSYLFKVRSMNENGVWNKEPKIFSFSITAPFWKQNWFIISYISLGVLLISLIIWMRVGIVKRKSRMLREKLQMEKQTLILEQKALRLQMNPHFIFHTLNSIQALIATKEEGIAREYLAKFSRLMRQILENSRANEISLDAEIETLENYLSIERFCNENKFDFKLNIPDDLEVEFIKIPPMLIQPFLENAIIHGLGHKEEKGMLSVSFKDEQQHLVCTIEDNGVGRAQAAEYNKVSQKQHKSTAMAVTSERLKYISAVENSLEIIDLKEGDKALGTRVILRLPILE